MTPSLLQDDDRCYVTGSRYNLDRHHCLHGSYRKAADKWGLWVWLRHDIHMDVHQRDIELDRRLQREAQEAFEKKYGHEKFMEVFGRSFL